MKIVDEQGNIVLYDTRGLPVTVAKVSYGISYGVNKEKQDAVTRVTVFTQYADLTDVWLFYREDKLPFHHIQTRDLIPSLKEIYLEFILKSEDKSFKEFLTLIISDYFITTLGYTLRGGESVEELTQEYTTE
jgi:hypothetical protein